MDLTNVDAEYFSKKMTKVLNKITAGHFSEPSDIDPEKEKDFEKWVSALTDKSNKTMSTRNNLKVLVLVGPPASGKTTFANEYVVENVKWVRVSRDSFREMLKNENLTTFKIETLIQDLAFLTIHKALSKNLNVIVDDTNLLEASIKEIIKEFVKKADIEFKLFEIPFETALARDSTRNSKVGKSAIQKMYARLETLKNSFNFETVPKLSIEEFASLKINSKCPKNPNLSEAVIFDIDGTLAIMNRFPFDWEKVALDYPNESVIEHCRMHFNHGRRVILMSGRDCSSRLPTGWLLKHGVLYHELHMRGMY